MDVAPTGDRGRVAKPVGGLPHGLDDGAPGGGRLGGTLGVPERAVGEDRAGPCPEVLRAHVGPRDPAQVVVHVVGPDVVRQAVRTDVLEELLARQVLAATDQRGQTPVTQADLGLAAGLAAEPEADRASRSPWRAAI